MKYLKKISTKQEEGDYGVSVNYTEPFVSLVESNFNSKKEVTFNKNTIIKLINGWNAIARFPEYTERKDTQEYNWGIANLEILSGVSIIGEDAFADQKFSAVTLPNSVTKVERGGFQVCENLSSITMPNVTSIGDYAFYKDASLKDVNIPKVKNIGMETFEGCTSLSSITMPNIQTIESLAFVDCTSLSNVTIGNSITSIGDNAFANCSSLKSITYQGTEAQWKKKSLGDNWLPPFSLIFVVYCTDTNPFRPGIQYAKINPSE